ncbi:hypothetical protein FRC03_009161 [Tulasnella sp. 419]|nr:hypothetical protein FRC03_009161 [Tulasnella sp. 419]
METQDLYLSEHGIFVPLPFRVLALVGLGIICWASNLHILHLLGIDTAHVLEVRSTELKLPTSAPTSRPASPMPSSPSMQPKSLHYSRSSSLYLPVYRIFGLYMVWSLGSWILFKFLVGGDIQRMDYHRSIPLAASFGIFVVLFLPFDVIHKRERYIFLSAIRRCLSLSDSQPVYFCDVILADIFTSFAKVLGDIWVSTKMMLPGGSLFWAITDVRGWSEWIVPALISLPYVIRFKQCLIEYHGSGRTNTRALMNAVKYATSFPVIILSVAQKQVVEDLTRMKGATVAQSTTWHGEHQIFRLWLLFVCISSVYSFWWDVTNDWGLELFRQESLPVTPRGSPRPRRPTATASSLHPNTSLSVPSSFPPTRAYPFGLRSPLLFSQPAVYYLAIIINFILRFTWSMRLSPHMHTFAEMETGVFVVEACELLRRWLWVFFRVEWEACKKGLLVADEGNGLIEMDEREKDSMLST